MKKAVRNGGLPQTAAEESVKLFSAAVFFFWIELWKSSDRASLCCSDLQKVSVAEHRHPHKADHEISG